jgi:hypothetical protein
MMKSMLRSIHIALTLALLLPIAHDVAAKPSKSSSFSSGFSSRKSFSAPSKSSFGSFSGGSSSKSSRDSASSTPPSRGFGSFGRSAPAEPRKSESAFSQKLSQSSSEANALRTLDARRQAQAAASRSDAGRTTMQSPGSGTASSWGAPAAASRDNGTMGRVVTGGALATAAAGAHANSNTGYTSQSYAPPPPAPVVVHQDSGLSNVLAGAMIANAMNGSHARHVDSYPSTAPASNVGQTSVAPQVVPAKASQPSHSGSSGFWTVFLWLFLLGALGWGGYMMWKVLRARREANKPNYSFERN